jgi:hypothetical protein
MEDVSDPTSTRSVKIGSDERTGWSSDRPRRGNAPERKPDISVRGRVLQPTDRLRYTPGSLVLVAAPDAAAGERYLTSILEDRSALITRARVRRLLDGRVPAEALEEQTGTVLDTAVTKRLDDGEATVLVLDSFDPEEREHWLRTAAGNRRPRHLILLDGSAAEEDREALGDLRKALMAGGLGDEGFHTAIRLGGSSAAEVKKLVFRAPPKDD